MDELIKKCASEIKEMLAKGEVTPVELVEASANRISQIEPEINAMPTLCVEKALDRAKALTKQAPSDRPHARGWLGGMPISVKDLVETAGVRTTFGSSIYADYVPSSSDIMVQQMEYRGAIVIGKSNTPEFGAGASTFNEVFGKTRIHGILENP